MRLFIAGFFEIQLRNWKFARNLTKKGKLHEDRKIKYIKAFSGKY